MIQSRKISSKITFYPPFRWYLPDQINMSSSTFSATAEILGKPDFKIIHIDPKEVAQAFQVYLESASKLTGVSLDDISTSVNEMPADVNKVTLAQLLEHGMKLFDAVVWLTAGRPKTHPLQIDSSLTKERIPSLAQVADSVFYCYFMLMTQARYPVSRNEKEKPRIPNFLKTIMSLDQDQHVYVERICTFEPRKFDPKWAMYVKFSGLGQETISRFGLGVAGYRNFGPFGLYKAKPDMNEDLRPAFEFAKKIAKSAPSWNVHPLTRQPEVLTKRGNLNKNLSNLMLDAFTPEQLKEMVDAKIIYKIPDREPTHRNYYQWTSEDDITGTNLVFRST